MVLQKGHHLFLVLCGLAVVGASFLLGTRRAGAWPAPPCTACACKDVFAWWSPVFLSNGQGAKSQGDDPRPISYAMNINAGGTCGTPPRQANGTCDIWSYTQTTL